jgi:hypothetical protein
VKWSKYRVSKVLPNVGILPQHYTASQPERPRLESSPPAYVVRLRLCISCHLILRNNNNNYNFCRILTMVCWYWTNCTRGSAQCSALGWCCKGYPGTAKCVDIMVCFTVVDYRGSRVRSPAGTGNFSLYHRVQNGSGAHPASYPMCTRGSFPVGKRLGREADHSPPSSAEVKEWVELYLNSPNTPSWRGAQLKAQGQLYLLPHPTERRTDGLLCSAWRVKSAMHLLAVCTKEMLAIARQ